MTKKAHSSQVYIEYSPEYIIYQVTNQVLINLRGLKLYKAFFSDPNSIKLEMNYRKKKREKHKHMENKQYVINKPMGP